MTEDPGAEADVDSADRARVLDRLETALDYRFVDRGLLESALRHSSYAHEKALSSEGTRAKAEKRAGSNERLEFLGDAVLALVVAEALFGAKPEWREGELTRALHSIVEGGSLTQLARSLDLGAALRLGRTEESSGGHEKPSILEDAMEAVIGAMYLDGGLGVAQRFLGRVFAEALDADAVRVERDPKTELQESLMATVGEFPTYRLVRDSEVEGDDDRFTVEVASKGTVLGQGSGRTKRSAQKGAARAALEGRVEADTKEA